MDIDQSTHSISGLPVSIFHIQQQYQKHWNIIFLNYWWIFALLYELNFLLSNFLHGGLLIVLLLGFLWGSLLDGGGRLLDSSLLGFRGSSLPLKSFLFILFPSTQKPSRPIWNHLNRLDQVNLRLVVKSFGPIIATCNNISTPSKGVDITSGHSNDHKSWSFYAKRV